MNNETIDRNNLIKKRTAMSETRVAKAIFPITTNHHDTLFGGQALSWMDETAFIAATRFSRKSLVTVSSDRVDFTQAIAAGTIAELVATVVTVGNSSISVQVDIFVEDMYSDARKKAITGIFKFVAIDEHKKPTSVMAGLEDSSF
jgi:acyl-CoA hydrolase